MANRKADTLPLEWVRAFESAGRNSSFTAAALECGVTQAAISQRIRNLEGYLGVDLFVRQARGVALTVDGEAWLPHVTGALQSLSRSTDELFGTPLKKISISASGSAAQLWIIPRLQMLGPKPRMQISLSTMSIEPDFTKSNSLIELRYGRGTWRQDEGFEEYARLYQEALSPMATPALMATKDHWRDLPLIAVSGPRPGWQAWARAHRQDPLPEPSYRFDTFINALTAAKAGLGVILGSKPLCRSALVDKSLLQISPHELTPADTYWLVCKPGVPRKQWELLKNALCEPETALSQGAV